MAKQNLNSMMNYVYSISPYVYIVNTRLEERKIQYGNQKGEGGGGSCSNVKLNAGNNIKLSKNSDNSITIDVELKKDYKEKYSSGEYILKAGSDMDDVTELLLKSVRDNADAIDGEKINI